MCTLLLAWQAHPALSLVVAANRDEEYARGTAPARFWADAPELLAGRDLVAGGTWLGVTRSGRFAAITNVREPGVRAPASARSRGELVAGFLLAGTVTPEAYLAGVTPDRYAGFNLVVGDRSSLWYLTNRSGTPERLAPGIHGVSNARMDTPWPKVVRGKAGLARLVGGGAVALADVQALLADPRPAPDEALPDTGIGLFGERMLSPLFIETPLYGTCSSTAVVITADGRAAFSERTTNPTAATSGAEVVVHFVCVGPPAGAAG